jgi:hypothetical protein
MRELVIYQRTLPDARESELASLFNEEASQAGIKEENIISMNINTVILPEEDGPAVEATLYVFYWKDK